MLSKVTTFDSVRFIDAPSLRHIFKNLRFPENSPSLEKTAASSRLTAKHTQNLAPHVNTVCIHTITSGINIHAAAPFPVKDHASSAHFATLKHLSVYHRLILNRVVPPFDNKSVDADRLLHNAATCGFIYGGGGGKDEEDFSCSIIGKTQPRS